MTEVFLSLEEYEEVEEVVEEEEISETHRIINKI